MRIYLDTREKPRAIVNILSEFEKQGVEVIRQALSFGDYKNPDNPGICIDRKQNLLEVAKNLVQDRQRFLREVDRAHRADTRLIILVEHGGHIKSLEDVINWTNPRLRTSRYAISGERLYKIMRTMGIHYGFEWAFCDKRNTGKEIIRLLSEGSENHE